MKPPTGRRPKPRLLEVVRVEPLSKNMIRVIVAGRDLEDWPEGQDGGNIKLLLPEPGWTRDEFKAIIENGPRPTVRTYTARRYDSENNELWIDFVVHDGGGPACEWAVSAQPGSLIGVAGPSGVKLTTTQADWFLVCADMSAMPAAEAALESIPFGAKGHIVFEVQSENDKRKIDHPPGMQVHWLIHADSHKPSQQQIELVQSFDWAQGRAAIFVAGESGVIRAFRHWLVKERQLPKEDLYISGYWKIGLIEDEHQAEKRNNL
ncbi:MAG: siderophore-interacting protein [Pseudomonadota bacterium]